MLLEEWQHKVIVRAGSRSCHQRGRLWI